VHTLCETAGRGGNLLLNVSPDGAGAIPPVQAERLAAIGAWMARHAVAVRGTAAGLEPWQFYGPSTRAGDCTYLFLLARPYETVSVRGLPVREVRAVRHVASGEELAFERVRTAEATILGDPNGELVITVPEALLDDLATVLSVQF
jgi:alpha-L-fucosidase